MFLAFPEVKCLAATITWNGGLNDAQINHGVWLDAGGGPVRTADGLVGSLFQTLRMLDAQTARLAAYAKTTAERVQVLGTDLVKKLEELETVRAEVEALRGGDAGG